VAQLFCKALNDYQKALMKMKWDKDETTAFKNAIDSIQKQGLGSKI
jgi:hypothetical protein